MGRIWKAWTFWFALAAMLGIALHCLRIDDVGLFIGLNPVLFFLDSKQQCRDWINGIPGGWYILSFVTMSLYGLWLDFLHSFRKTK